MKPCLSSLALLRRVGRGAQWQRRSFAATTYRWSTSTIPASELNENITQEEKDHFAEKLAQDKEKQMRRPWHREGSDKPPVARQRSAGAMTKGTYAHARLDNKDL